MSRIRIGTCGWRCWAMSASASTGSSMRIARWATLPLAGGDPGRQSRQEYAPAVIEGQTDPISAETSQPSMAPARGINRLIRSQGRSIAAGVRPFLLQRFKRSEFLGKPGLLEDGICRVTR
jgi:hypothetical protein